MECSSETCPSGLSCTNQRIAKQHFALSEPFDTGTERYDSLHVFSGVDGCSLGLRVFMTMLSFWKFDDMLLFALCELQCLMCMSRGWGLRALQELRAGDIVMEIVGQV